MTVEVVVDGGEVIEVEEGADSLSRWAAEHYHATSQIKGWEKRKAIASRVLEALQEAPKATYPAALGSIVITKRGPAMTAVVNTQDLADVELTYEDRSRLIAAAKSFNWTSIDPGLKGSKPDAWKPRTPLGELVKDLAQLVPLRGGYVLSEAATLLAEGE